VYSGEGKSVTLSTNPEGLIAEVTYNGSATLPVDAGLYLVEASIGDLNYTGSANATLTITPATAAISFEDLNQTYDGTEKSVTVNTVPSGINANISYDGGVELPVNAGSYLVEVTINGTNYVGSGSATLTVNPAVATASAEGIYFIDEGDALPEFSTIYGGFVGGDDASVVIFATFNLSPEYSGDAGTYAVIPAPVLSTTNYIFNTINGTLYVNPSGPGTKQVKPVFICSEEMLEPDENGYSFIAYLEYENKNQDNVYVPIGPENLVSGTASVDNSEQPELFLAGGGTLTMPFDGNEFTWQVTSNKNNGSKGAIPANTSNATCGNKSNDQGTLSEEKVVTIYPNPSSGQVFVQLNKQTKTEARIELFDSTGRQHQVEIKQGKGLYQINLSGYTKGLYLVKISIGDQVEVRRLIIQ